MEIHSKCYSKHQAAFINNRPKNKKKILLALYWLKIIDNNDSSARYVDLKLKCFSIPLPTQSKKGEKDLKNSLKMNQHLSDSIQQITTFDFVTHLQVINEEKKKIKILTLKHNNDELSSWLQTEEEKVVRQIAMSRETSLWLTTLPSTVNRTELSALMFRESRKQLWKIHCTKRKKCHLSSWYYHPPSWYYGSKLFIFGVASRFSSTFRLNVICVSNKSWCWVRFSLARRNAF